MKRALQDQTFELKHASHYNSSGNDSDHAINTENPLCPNSSVHRDQALSDVEVSVLPSNRKRKFQCQEAPSDTSNSDHDTSITAKGQQLRTIPKSKPRAWKWDQARRKCKLLWPCHIHIWSLKLDDYRVVSRCWRTKLEPEKKEAIVQHWRRKFRRRMNKKLIEPDRTPEAYASPGAEDVSESCSLWFVIINIMYCRSDLTTYNSRLWFKNICVDLLRISWSYVLLTI